MAKYMRIKQLSFYSAIMPRRKKMQPGRSIFVMLFILLILLTTGHAGDLNKDLINAVKKGDTKAVDSYLAEGADPNARDLLGGGLALIIAAQQDHLKVAESLLAGGAEIDATYKNGGTALMYAAHANHPDIVRLLVSKGADINLKNSNGNTALYYADKFNYSEIIQILREAGAKE